MTGPLIAPLMIALVALEHVAFGVIEMFFWNKPLGRKIFRTETEFAEKSKVLAANQGLYNYFLAAGLLTSFALDPASALSFRFFFLGCVFVAGAYGAATIHFRVFLFQGLPAAAAFFFLVLGL